MYNRPEVDEILCKEYFFHSKIMFYLLQNGHTPSEEFMSPLWAPWALSIRYSPHGSPLVPDAEDAADAALSTTLELLGSSRRVPI